MIDVKKVLTVLVVLDYPVNIGGVDYTELTMRRPLVRDMKTAQKASTFEAEKETVLFANLCEVTPEVIDSMDYADYAKLGKALADFQSPSSTNPN